MIFGSDGRQYCWKRLEDPLKSSHNRWGLDSELYCQILTEDFLGTLSYYDLEIYGVIFQQDNDPKHISNRTKDWFFNNGIKVLDWPAQSPDLNPIEHLWNKVDRRLRKLPVQISGKEDLWDKI
ncbi:hypothetical protein RclHR1_18890004 [Rhizophagus clarus]|uniref:Tc1-like transposase DDE domain-containing protein n=1 Tax=Rhizophagus clarus TaxID=94130 RepID=A0A2Z6QPS8_9GLOM|nr:hypothetical protein RclHR1_18890004 [Rhizophagus clarus]